MKRRTFGLENEYGLTYILGGQLRLSPDNVARYLFEKVIPAARLYLDTGFHPEYATPECDDVAELVSHDKAGERIVEDLRLQASLTPRLTLRGYDESDPGKRLVDVLGSVLAPGKVKKSAERCRLAQR